MKFNCLVALLPAVLVCVVQGGIAPPSARAQEAGDHGTGEYGSADTGGALPAPAVNDGFGVYISTLTCKHGHPIGAIVTGVKANSPATQVIVNGQKMHMVRNDVITSIYVKADGGWKRKSVMTGQDLIKTIKTLQPGEEFKIQGLNAADNYKPYTAIVTLNEY